MQTAKRRCNGSINQPKRTYFFTLFHAQTYMLPKAYPVAGVAVAYIVGILLAEIATVPSVYGYLAVLVGLLAIGAYRYVLRAQYGKPVYVEGLGIHLLFALLGFFRTQQVTPQQHPDHLLHVPDSLITYYHAVAQTPLEETARSRRATLSLVAVRADSTWQPAVGKLMAYFPKDDSLFSLAYGEELLIRGRPQLVPPPTNPRAFDYRAYLLTQGVTHQHFLRAHTFEKTGQWRGNYAVHWAGKARAWCVAQFHRYLPVAESRAIVLALVLGVKNELDNALREVYAGAGAMHVLAVSGLHVGILVAILGYLLLPLRYLGRREVYAKGVVSLLFLWGYAFLTGLSPSVMRAVTMFSIVLVGQMLNRKGNIYNTLALSALFLLFYNPYMLYQVGFQLSFSAVLGIVWLYPFFVQVYTFENKVAQWAWELTCVSLAAQLATFPFGLYYFHQFPNYFFLSNLIVIPGAALVLCGGLLVLATSVVPMLAEFVGFVTTLCTQLMNMLVKLLTSLPHAVTQHVYIDLTATLLLFLLVIFAGKLWTSRRVAWAQPLVGVAFLWGIWQSVQQYAPRQEVTLGVYHTRKQANLAFLAHGQTTVLADSTLLADAASQKFAFYEDLLARGLPTEGVFRAVSAPPAWLPMSQPLPSVHLMVWQGKRIVWLRGRTQSSLPLEADYVLVSHNALRNFDDWPTLRAPLFVFDATNSFYALQRLELQAAQRHQAVHIVAKDGAWHVPLTPSQRQQ